MDSHAYARHASFLPRPRDEPMKFARILDQDGGTFGLEYDNTLGEKHTMRLDALSYERAITEAKAFLEVGPDDLDADGTQWEIQ